VALDAVKESQTMAELAMRFDLSPAQIAVWKQQLAHHNAGFVEDTAKAEKPGVHAL